MQPTPSVDLTNCDREPIHIPGSIQPHGCLLACDSDVSSIRRHSANAAAMLAGEGLELVGVPLDNVIGERAVHNIRNALATSPDASRPGLIMSLRTEFGRAYDVAVHRHKGNAIVEFEEEPPDRPGDPLALARMLLARLKRFGDPDQMLQQTPRLMRALLDYDRVMIYRFGHDGSGQVVGESKREDLETFLGQYFPASDIPRQARELYLKNTIRIISDAACHRVPVEPALDASGEPLDLSFAHLRSVSPIHCEYLRNMGVAASMSISIIVGGQLWGLIACHHYEPRTLAMAERIAAEMFGEFFSLHLQAMLQRQRLEAAMAARGALDGLLREITYQDDIESFLRDQIATFGKLIPCDGVGLWINGSWHGHGSVPPKAALPALAGFVASASEGRVWAAHELSALLPGAAGYCAEVSGVLAVPLSQIPRDYLFFFRKEVVQTVEWGGNPEKTYETGPHGDRLTPRKSFAIWRQTVERQSKPWTDADREIAEAARTALLEVIMRQTELLSAERRKADLRQKVLNEELNHRVKNILALIQSVVSQAVEDGRSLDEYVATLKGRIMALSVSHDQVVRNDGGGRLRDLLDAELTPYGGGSAQVVLEGPDIGLDARAYSVMALVFHELATNAAKYGALSASEGRLTVRWTVTPEQACEVRWEETGGPPVSPPKRRGFGTVLVERSVPFDLGGESTLSFAGTGASARFLIPAEFASAFAPAMRQRRGASSEVHRPADALAGLRVLVVEDQLVIAMDVEAVLADHGVQAIDTAATSSEALRILASKPPDVAVLDVNLGQGTSIPVAEELRRQRIPFVFATGYGDTAMIPENLANAPVVRKPHDASTLVAAVAASLQSPK
jgi:light-regulated signal transduction histidine kinase (bacteriophytochrome)/CheY-like chemotaxis protein